MYSPNPVPPPECPVVTPKPSTLCALVCASVAAAYDRRWLSAPVSSFLPPDVSPERLSRLKASVLPAFEAQVTRATARGRPPQVSDDRDARLAASQALLHVAANVIKNVKVRGRRNKELMVEAARRLRREHGITLKHFASSLGIPVRTFRSWANRPPAPPQPPPPPVPPSPPPPSRNLGRFNLDVTPPGLQAVADTTSIEAFGVNLHLVGSQDIGNRHRQLLQSFQVVPQESSEVVVDVLSKAFSDPSGTQALVDQGTPYIAEATKKALENLQIDLCPQKEATPTEKATLERAWRTIKEALAPLLGLTNRLAQAIPTLRNTELARSITELLVAVFLRVYLSGRVHLTHPLEGRDPLALVEIIEEAKERARAEDRSKKLLLQDIHARYAMWGSAARFVRAHRRHALQDIQEAERRIRKYACRCRVKACDRYFATVLANVAEKNRRRRAYQRRILKEARQREAERQSEEQRKNFFEAHTEELMREGLDMIACQWRPAEGKLLFEGKGLGKNRLRQAVRTMVQKSSVFWKDEVQCAWKSWTAGDRNLPESAVLAIKQVLDSVIEQAGPISPASDLRGKTMNDRRNSWSESLGGLTPISSLLPDALSAILGAQAQRTKRPPPLRHLRI